MAKGTQTVLCKDCICMFRSIITIIILPAIWLPWSLHISESEA